MDGARRIDAEYGGGADQGMSQAAGGPRLRVRAILMWWLFAALMLAIGFLLNRMKTPQPPETGDRVANARKRCEAELRAIFQRAGVNWPAEEVFLRGMKREAQLE